MTKQMYAHVENDQIMYLYFHNYGIFLQHEDTQSSLYNNNNKKQLLSYDTTVCFLLNMTIINYVVSSNIISVEK